MIAVRRGSPNTWLTRRWVRRRRVAVAPIALVVAGCTAAAMMALTASQRTSSAYDDFLDRSDAGDVLINASLPTEEIDAFIRGLPDVERVTTHTMFFVTEGGEPRTRAELAAVDPLDPLAAATVWGSSDGRFVDMDRPIVRDGRMATGPNEAVLDEGFARAGGLAIGDTFELAFWEGTLEDPARVLGLDARETDAYWDAVVTPIGVERVEVVGVVALADQVLRDNLFPALRMIVSPDIAARYDCTVSEPSPGAAHADVVKALLPLDCATLYRYQSLRITNGCTSCVLEAIVNEMARRNAVLRDIPDLGAVNAALAAEGVGPAFLPGYFLIPTETDREAARVAQAVRPTATALMVLGLSASVLGVVLAGLLMARETRRAESDQRQWEQLGVARRERAVVVAAPSVAAVLVGGLAGGLTGWWFAPGPVGLVAVVAAPPSRPLVPVAVAAAVGIAAVGVGLAWVVAARSVRNVSSRSVPAAPTMPSLLVDRPLPIAVADGLRAAFVPRSAVPMIGGTAVLVGVFVAAALFASSLTALLSTPRSYGWPWDVAAMSGYGYGGVDVDEVFAALDDDPGVEAFTVLGLSNDVSLGPDPMMSVLLVEGGTGGLTLLDGREPIGRDEVALGATTAGNYGVGVGDTIEVRRPVEVGGSPEPITATVTGIVTFPVLGQFEAEHVSVGTGMLVPEASVGSELARYAATFVGVELSDAGRDPAEAARVGEVVGSFGWGGVLVYDAAVRPSQIADAASTRPVPIAVAAVFAGLLAAGLVAASWASVRSRRRHLAVLRALGCDTRQIRSSVVVHSLATAAAALVLGLAPGIIAGRALWRGFASELGVVPDPASSWGPVGLTILGVIALSLLAAVVPAALATRPSPAASLSSE